MKPSFPMTLVPLSIAAMLSGCSHQPPPEPLRAVRTVEIRYDKTQETDRYFGSVQSRYEVDQAFRVSGKVASRKVDVGQKVRQGDVIAVLDDSDYKLAAEAARQQLTAAEALGLALGLQRLVAGRVELAHNRVEYTVLRASQDGVVTSVKFEVGQVVAEGQPIVSIAKDGEPEIVVNVPEDQLSVFKASRYKATLTSAPDQSFEVVLRELSPQAASTTRTFRARLKPATPRPLPLGASATLVVDRPIADNAAAAIPAVAISQNKGHSAVWAVRREGAEPVGTVQLIDVSVHAYHNDEVLVSGPAAGELVVTAGVQKMSPGLKVSLPDATGNLEAKQAAR